MFTIDLTIRNTPFPLSVQRKTVEEAEASYQEIISAMHSLKPEILELKCDGKTEKRIAVRTSEISGLQMLMKDGATIGGGRPPGFFAMAE